MAEYSDNTPERPGDILPAHPSSKIVFDSYYRSLDNFVRPMRELWSEWFDLYRCYFDRGVNSLVTQTFMPVVFSNVESLLPRLIANRPRIEVWGRSAEDEVRASRHRSLLFYDWEVLRMVLRLIDIAKGGEIFGLQWIKVSHRKMVRERIVRRVFYKPRTFMGVPLPGTSSPEIREVPAEVTEWDDPWVELPEIDLIFPDPDGRDEMDCAYIIEEIPGVSIEHLENAKNIDGEPLYDQSVVRKLKELILYGRQEQTGETTVRQHDQILHGPGVVPDVDIHKRETALLEYWTDYKVIAVAKDYPELPPLRNESHHLKRKPYRRFTPIPVANNLQGISIPAILGAMNLEMNVIHGARIDNLLYSVHRLVSIIRGSNINPRQLRRRPGGHVWVDSHSDLQFHDMPRLDVSMYREEEQIRRHVQLAGFTDTFMGINARTGGGTATEASQLAQASGAKSTVMFEILSEQVLKEMGRDLIFINENFIDEPRRLRILGDDFKETYVEIDPIELLTGSGLDLDLVIDVAATEPATRQFKLQQAMQGIGTLAQLGMPAQDPVVQRMIETMLRGFGIENPEPLLAESREMMERMQAQAQAAEAAGGGGAPPNDQNVQEMLARQASEQAPVGP